MIGNIYPNKHQVAVKGKLQMMDENGLNVCIWVRNKIRLKKNHQNQCTTTQRFDFDDIVLSV
jgi:hypothetical protein